MSGISDELRPIMDDNDSSDDFEMIQNMFTSPQQSANYDYDATLSPRSIRRVYMATYSQAEPSIFPSKGSFANAVNDAFGHTDNPRKIEQWACYREPHNETSGFHYHHFVKVEGSTTRWEPVKERLCEKFGIVVNFTKLAIGSNIAGYRYISKHQGDDGILHSPGHKKFWRLTFWRQLVS